MPGKVRGSSIQQLRISWPCHDTRLGPHWYGRLSGLAVIAQTLVPLNGSPMCWLVWRTKDGRGTNVRQTHVRPPKTPHLSWSMFALNFWGAGCKAGAEGLHKGKVPVKSVGMHTGACRRLLTLNTHPPGWKNAPLLMGGRCEVIFHREVKFSISLKVFGTRAKTKRTR